MSEATHRCYEVRHGTSKAPQDDAAEDVAFLAVETDRGGSANTPPAAAIQVLRVIV